MSKDESHIVEMVVCECGSMYHNVIFSRIDEDNWADEMFISIHLVEGPWYERVWKAIKYVFGYTNVWGHYDEIVIGPDKAKDIINYLNKFLERNEGKKDVQFSKELV
jgi:hypothetical protein